MNISDKRAIAFTAFYIKTPGCWEWTGAQAKDGYGVYHSGRKTLKAHRVAYFLAAGPFDETLMVCHRCDNRICVRPDHLFLGTAKDNTQDAIAKGRVASGDRSGMARSEVRAKLSTTKKLWHAANPGAEAGENNRSAKLTLAQVCEIRQRYERGSVSQAALAAEYGIAQTTVSAVVRGKRWGA